MWGSSEAGYVGPEYTNYLGQKKQKQHWATEISIKGKKCSFFLDDGFMSKEGQMWHDSNSDWTGANKTDGSGYTKTPGLSHK